MNMGIAQRPLATKLLKRADTIIPYDSQNGLSETNGCIVRLVMAVVGDLVQ
jgi:hypothetical protein